MQNNEATAKSIAKSGGGHCNFIYLHRHRPMRRLVVAILKEYVFNVFRKLYQPAGPVAYVGE